MSETRPARPQPPTQAGAGRRLFHLLMAVAGWALFLWWWWLVLGRTDPAEVRFTAIFIVVTLALCVGVTALWAAHNISIFRRRGPRTRVRDVKYDFSRDRLGRSVSFTGSLEQMEVEPIVHIRLEHEGKVYRTASSVEAAIGNGSAVFRLPERSHGTR